MHLVSAVCGGLILVALLAMKFIGPPPRAFVVRASIVVVMLVIMGYTVLWRTASTVALAAAAALGFALLTWYAREG